MRAFRVFVLTAILVVLATTMMGCGSNDKASTKPSGNQPGSFNFESKDDKIRLSSKEAIRQEAKDSRRVKRRIAELCKAKGFNSPEASRSLSDAFDRLLYESLEAAYGAYDNSAQTRIKQVVRWTKRCKRSKSTYRNFAKWYEGPYAPLPKL